MLQLQIGLSAQSFKGILVVLHLALQDLNDLDG